MRSDTPKVVDADALYRQASAALNGGGATVQVAVNTVEPTKDSSDVNGRFGMITQAVTNASSSNKNRLTNLRLACAALNGYCIQPGETFSFNQVVGQRTAKRGYKKATVYQSGELAEDIGGGVCQVSTTLWNAAMKANCEIVERSEHSRTVAYVDKGKDATVSDDRYDFVFTNNTGANIYIELVEFDAYNLPNEALNSGDIDLNAFQHKAYLALSLIHI